MTFIIYHIPSGDSLTIQGDTLEECLKIVMEEVKKRGWLFDDCWSELV